MTGLLSIFRKTILTSLVILVLADDIAKADDGVQFGVRHFTEDNGLPQNSVKHIAMDDQGFVWLATEDGLVRYDGWQFLNFNQSRLPLQSSRIWSLQPISREPGRVGSFIALTADNDCMRVDDGLAFIDSPALETFLNAIPSREAYSSGKALIAHGLPNRFSAGIRADSYIIPDGDGFYECTNTHTVYYRNGLPQYRIQLQVADFWSFFRMGRYLYWMNPKGQCMRLGEDPSAAVDLSGDILNHPSFSKGRRNFTLYWNNAAAAAFIGLDSHLYTLEETADGSFETRLILEGFDLDKNFVSSVYYDARERTVFLGSLTKGLYVFRPHQFHTVRTDGGDQDNVYYAQYPWDSGRVLTAQGSILGLSGNASLPLVKKYDEGDRYSMLIDRNGSIWIKSGRNLYQFNKDGSQLVGEWSWEEELTQLCEGADGWIWIGTKAGLCRMNSLEPGNGIRRINTRTPIPGEVSCMQEDESGLLWIGTNNGLYLFDREKDRVDSLAALQGVYVRSIYSRRSGEIWITTAGKGCFLYSAGRLVRLPADRDQYLDNAHCMIEDDAGFLWVSTNRGLFKVSRVDLISYATGRQQSVYYHYFSKESGFKTNEFNGGCQPCAAVLPNGYFSLPSLNGIVFFDPMVVQITLPDKKIFIDRIEVDGANLSPATAIVLPRNFKRLSISCSSPYMESSHNTNMEYAWVRGGDDTLWLPVRPDQVISEAPVETGRYNLAIRKLNGFGKDNFDYRVLQVSITPAFYETTLFYVLVLLLTGLLVWVYVWLRTRNIHHRNIQLKKLISDRTEELENTLHALSNSEQDLRRQMHIREQLITAISHDVRSPLKYVSVVAQHLLADLEKENVPEHIKKLAEGLFQSGHYLYHLTSNLLQYMSVSRGKGALQTELFDLYNLVEERVLIFRTIAEESGIEIINSVPQGFLLHTDPRLLEVIIHNLLDNAVKVTRNGKITVRTGHTGQSAYLLVCDTGPGIPAAVARWFNAEACDTLSDRAPDVHTGFGLIIVREMARLAGLAITFLPSDTGTVARILFPGGDTETEGTSAHLADAAGAGARDHLPGEVF